MNVICTKNAPAAVGPYSQAIDCGDFVFLSGQIPLVPETGLVAKGGLEAQAHQMFANIQAVLAEAGMSLSNVVKTTVFMTALSQFAAFNAVYGKYFTEKPARSCVAVRTLPKNVLCEVEAIAEVK